MTDRSACHLFKQTRVNLDWTEKRPTTTIDVPLPGHPGRSSRSLDLRKRAKHQEHPDTEEKFKFAHHASSASIYYRPAERFPRSILWRLVEDSHVLSISAVDFTKPESHAELETTFRFVFPEPIQPGTVGFADAPTRDELVVYALTRDGVLYTLSLTPDFIQRNSFLKRGAQTSSFCTTYCPSAFTLHSPHFLLPINHESLLIPLQDGNILKLVRNHRSLSDHSEPPTVASYTEKSFSDSGYFGFFKNKMPWVGGGTVSYGRGSVTHSTVVSAIAHTPTAARPNLKPLLFTVSVDHTLKVWSLDQECLIRAQDLLNDAQGTATSKMKTWLDPSPSHLLEIIDHPIEEDHSFYLVSFSSAANGKFKFWAATHHQDGQFNELQDIYPEESFEAKPPSTVAPWIVSEFKVTPAATEGPRIFDLWILWKSDTNFQVQSVRFDITDVNSTWGQWTTATDDTLHNLPRPTAAPETVEEVTEHWKKWIFYPGRFPDTILESALRIYENNFLVPTGTNISTETIQSRAARVVSAAVHLDADSMRDEDYDAYRADMALQWDRFSRLCTELDKQRREALSLVSDPQSGFVWTVNVDGITALRECTETEAIWHNFTTVPENFTTLSNRTQGRLGAGLAGDALGDVMKLMAAANELSESLSEKVVHACSERLRSEIVNDPLLAVQDSMFKIYQQLLEPEVYDETHEKLRDIFNSIENPENAFRSMMSSLFHQPDSHVGQARLTKFGAKVLIGGTQEIIHINHQLLFQLLYLLVYVTYADYEADFLRISRPESIYHQLLGYFREYEVLNWMALSSAQLAASPVVPEDDISTALTDLHVSGETPNSRLGKRGSVLQLVLPDNFGPSPAGPGRSGLFSLSVCVRKFLAGLEISEYGNGVPHVAAALLRANATGPATDFAKFLPSTAWGTYMKGRIQLKAHNFALAAQSFNKAAYGMAMGTPAAFSATTVFSAESGAVGSGLAKYHLHIADLFQEEKAPECVVDSCNAALLATGSKGDATLMADVLLKYFQAAVKVSLFDEAYLALARFAEGGLRRSAVRDLVSAMVEKNEGARLCKYPWIGVQDEVDAALSHKCSQILDVSAGPPFHKVLYAWRIQRGDYRGAAFILHERLQRLQTANVGSTDPNSRVVTDGYLALINVLSCVDEDQAWILSDKRVEGSDGITDRGTKRARLDNSRSATHLRQVLTLADIKEQYRTEVERVGLLLNGGFFV